MVEDRLATGLENKGYRRIDSNARGIYLYYLGEGSELTVVSVIRAVNGNEITPEQYEHILEQVKSSFHNSYPQPARLLSLILTNHPGEVKQLCTQTKEDTRWIIDLYSNRLIIYENQTTELAGLRDLIDELLLEEKRNLAENNPTASKGFDQPSGYYGVQQQPQKMKLFTPVNTIIIAVNVVFFLILHYSSLFGGEEQMVEKGALSWYYVLEQKEYYRVITSMFMHSGWSHLFNNMLVLLFVGDNLERAAGKLRYLFIYFGAGILAGSTSISYNMWKDYGQLSLEGSTLSIGASGAIFGIVGAVLYIVIINRGRLEDINTRQMILFVIFSLYGGVSNVRIDQAAHIGGFISGILLAALLYRRPKEKTGIGEERGT